MSKRNKIRTMARAYRIWGYCEPREWNCTVAEIAEVLNIPVGSVSNICRSRDWLARLRAPAHRPQSAGSSRLLPSGDSFGDMQLVGGALE